MNCKRMKFNKMTIDQINWQKDNFENIKEAWEGDLWDRKRLGEQLTGYVDRLQCGAVLALDARWGEGKTWFVRHWAKYLSDTDHNVIYLDAFANDYLDDPFLVISSEITNILNQDKRTKRKVKKLIELSASVGTALLPSLPKIALTLGLHLVGAGFLSGALQQSYENAKDEIDTLSDEASERIKESIQEKIATHEAEKKTLIEFKKHLAETVEKLDKPLVFIIDELDRCRPDFSIRLIERIKHFFDIKNIVFVLVMDKVQFSKVVCHNYGYDETLGEAYLDKFVDFTIHLKQAKDSENFELIIRDQLFKIGELKSIDEFSELYYWALYLQLHVKMNSRELIKKINQYALLRADTDHKNLVLITFLFGSISANNFKSFVEEVSQNLIKSSRGDVYQFARKHGISTWNGNYDEITNSEWYRIIMQKEFLISNPLLNTMIAAFHDSARSQDKSTKEQYLRGGLVKFAISEYTNSCNFSSDWENYIKRGI